MLAANSLVSGRAQRRSGLVKVGLFDQDVIRIKRRDGEDRNLRGGERLHERCQHSSQRKRKRPLELESDPSALNERAIG